MMAIWKRGVTLILCFLETAILGGAMWGWPSLVYVLQGDELYIDRCQPKPDTMVLITGNASTPPSFLYVNRTSLNSNSLGAITDLRIIKKGFSTDASANSVSYVNNGTVTTASTLGVYTDQDEAKDNTESYADSDTNNTVMVTSQTVIRCNDQKVALSLSYTVAAAAFGISALPIGVFFDRFGLRTTRTITAFFAIAGYFQLAFAKRGREWMLLTGAVFIGPTCYTLLITNFHVAKLAGKRISLAITIYAAAMNTSFAYQLVKMAYDAGVTRMVGLLTLALLWLVVIFTSWFLLPKDKINNNVLGIGKLSKNANSRTKVEDPAQTQNMTNVGEESEKEEKLVAFISSATYITFLYWFCANYVCLTMVISSYDAWISEIVDGDLTKVTFYTDFLAYGTLAGSLLTPTNGFITDFMLAKYGRGPGGKSLTMLPAALLSCFIMALVNVPLLFNTETAIYAVGVLFLIGKPLFQATPAIYMGIVPPMQYYGIVFGILNASAGGAVLMTYPYMMWAVAAQSFKPVFFLILATSMLAFSFPLMLCYERWTQVRRNEKSKQQCAEIPQNTPEWQQQTTKL